jgi:hypothetical protein
MRDPNWVELTDAERGQLVAIWLLAADRDGTIPNSAATIQKLCFMQSEPSIDLFVSKGFIEWNDGLTPERRRDDIELTTERRQHDAPKAEEETEEEEEKSKRKNAARSARVVCGRASSSLQNHVRPKPPHPLEGHQGVQAAKPSKVLNSRALEFWTRRADAIRRELAICADPDLTKKLAEIETTIAEVKQKESA